MLSGVSKLPLLAALCITLVGAATTVVSAKEASIPSDVTAILGKYCIDCHGADSPEADVPLVGLGNMDLEARLSMLNRAHQQLHFHLMPPEDEAQPTKAEHARLVKWISSELTRHDANDLSDKLRKPEYANDVNHEDLFSGKYAALKGFTYDRQWLLSEYIFNQKMSEVLGDRAFISYKGKSYELFGRKGREALTNPFLLPERAGVRYYADEILSGSQFLTMAANAEYAAGAMVGRMRGKDKHGYLPVTQRALAPSEEHRTIVAARKDFLQKHIARVCEDIYKAQNASFLPQHPPIVVGKVSENAAHYGKWGWRNGVGYSEGTVLLDTLKIVPHKDRPREDVIEDCARYWYHWGENQTVVEMRVHRLCGHLGRIQKHKGKNIQPHQYRPLPAPEMAAIESTIRKLRTKGMPYKKLIAACVAHWQHDFKSQRDRSAQLTDSLMADVVKELYTTIHRRPPTKSELADRSALFRAYAAELDEPDAVEKLIQTLILTTEFIARDEYGEGKPDAYGRTMLSPRNASYAIAYALTDSSPDEQLAKAAAEGRLRTKDDYRREVLRILADRSKYSVVDATVHSTGGIEDVTNLPVRKIRFFREFFGFHKVHTLFKDDKRFGGSYVGASMRLLAEADLLLGHILEKDKNVFEELLTTERFYVWHSGDNDHMAASAVSAAAGAKAKYEYFAPLPWQTFGRKELMQHKDKVGFNLRAVKEGKKADVEKAVNRFKSEMKSLEEKLGSGWTFMPGGPRLLYGTGPKYAANMNGDEVLKFYDIDGGSWNYPAQQPTPLPNRKGMLSHPVWLIAFSQNFQTDPVTRGKWIREKLLAGMVPDVPITVDAAIPEDHTRTLRDRLAGKTGAAECWKCHKHMNPIGNAFEMYDDFGRFRTQEELEHPDNILNLADEEKVKPMHRYRFRYRYKSVALDTTGVLEGTGDKKLDGDVRDAIDLIDRLAKSERVRQSIIRHAFRYFMGRNEDLSDSKTLIDADQAYVKSGGSFDAVIVSLLTSDSFIYRKPVVSEKPLLQAASSLTIP
jgi:hypothetical protein